MQKKSISNSLLFLLIILSTFLLGEEAKAKSTIAIISLYSRDYKNIGEYSDENKKNYANKHGYDLFLYHDRLNHSRPVSWSKIIAIQSHLANYKWVYWSNADSLIMNTEIKLEEFIDDKYDLIISKGYIEGNINTGNFLIKNSKWSHDILKKIFDQKQFIKHHLGEQKALQDILHQDPKECSHIKVYEQRVLNANYGYGNPDYWYQNGDFIVHFYGQCNKEKLIQEWSKKIVY